jgi:hypothetical protein
MNRIGIVLLAIWLILTGLIDLFHLTFDLEGILMGLLALAAGVLLLLIPGGRTFRFGGRFSLYVLAAYLIIAGLIALLGLNLPYQNIILGLLALVAGVLLLVGRF